MEPTPQPEKPAEPLRQESVTEQEKRRKMVETQEDAAATREQEGGYQ